MKHKKRDFRKRWNTIFCGIFCAAALMVLSPLRVYAETIYTEGFFEYHIEEEAITICGYFGSETEVTVPAAIAGYPVSKIAAGAFSEADFIEKINLPDTIMTIEEGALGAGQSIVYDSNVNTGNTSDSTEEHKPANPDKDASTDASAGSDSATDTSAPADADKNTDTSAPADADKNTDTSAPADADKNTNTSAPADADKNTDTAASADAGKNANTAASANAGKSPETAASADTDKSTDTENTASAAAGKNSETAASTVPAQTFVVEEQEIKLDAGQPQVNETDNQKAADDVILNAEAANHESAHAGNTNILIGLILCILAAGAVCLVIRVRLHRKAKAQRFSDNEYEE